VELVAPGFCCKLMAAGTAKTYNHVLNSTRQKVVRRTIGADSKEPLPYVWCENPVGVAGHGRGASAVGDGVVQRPCHVPCLTRLSKKSNSSSFSEELYLKINDL
jgi:hypothetical protein